MCDNVTTEDGFEYIADLAKIDRLMFEAVCTSRGWTKERTEELLHSLTLGMNSDEREVYSKNFMQLGPL